MSRPASFRRRASSLVAVLVTAVLVVAGCSSAQDGPAATGSLLAEYGLTGLDVRQVVERLDTMAVADRPAGLMASVRPDALELSDDSGRRESLPMPADAVYLSTAPYRTTTHDCHFHSLTTCLGELPDAPVDVTVTAADGRVVLAETRRTFANGFVGVWVPRGLTGTMTVTHDGLTGSTPISTTSPDDRTCVTTLRLA